mgnify:CR=1 FL=1
MQNVQSVEITLHSGGSDSSGLLMNPKLDSSNARNVDLPGENTTEV